MEIFNVVIEFFTFIFQFITTISVGIINIMKMGVVVISLVGSIFRLLPVELYVAFNVFLNTYLAIFIYKLVRKG